jgi:hypothetical protein
MPCGPPTMCPFHTGIEGAPGLQEGPRQSRPEAHLCELLGRRLQDRRPEALAFGRIQVLIALTDCFQEQTAALLSADVSVPRCRQRGGDSMLDEITGASARRRRLCGAGRLRLGLKATARKPGARPCDARASLLPADAKTHHGGSRYPGRGDSTSVRRNPCPPAGRSDTMPQKDRKTKSYS